MKKLNDVARHSVSGYGRQDISYNDPDGEFVFYGDYKKVEQRAEAAEAKLAELEADISKVHSFGRKHGIAAMENAYLVANALAESPAPAADLADLVPGEFDNWKNPASEAMSAIGYVGNKQDFTMGANWMRAAVLRNINGGK